MVCRSEFFKRVLRDNLLRRAKNEKATIIYDFPGSNRVVDSYEGAKTGQIGDDKIFVLELDKCVRIRTGEIGNKAIG